MASRAVVLLSVIGLVPRVLAVPDALSLYSAINGYIAQLAVKHTARKELVILRQNAVARIIITMIIISIILGR